VKRAGLSSGQPVTNLPAAIDFTFSFHTIYPKKQKRKGTIALPIIERRSPAGHEEADRA
jgi:hypothetical protein